MLPDPVKIESSVGFGADFELDFQSYRLRRAGIAIKLERIPVEILMLLVERRLQVVTRAEIAERIWGKEAFLDIDNSINGAIRKIRRVLRDNPEQPRFIQTITGRVIDSWRPSGQPMLPRSRVVQPRDHKRCSNSLSRFTITARMDYAPDRICTQRWRNRGISPRRHDLRFGA